MRELAAAALLLLALAVGALAPQIWTGPQESNALASGAPVAPQSWVGKDNGTGFVVCGSSDTWTRPGLAEQNAHLAADPRYARLRADDSYSDAWIPFRAGASLYDGSDLGARIELIALTGMWSDPHIAAVATDCTSKEPQVWLVGYTPARYFANDSSMGELRVVPAPGYRMVVLTGVIRRELVVASDTKLGFFQMPASAITPTPAPRPKPTLAPTSSPEPPLPFPATGLADRQRRIRIPHVCEGRSPADRDIREREGRAKRHTLGGRVAVLFCALAQFASAARVTNLPRLGAALSSPRSKTISPRAMTTSGQPVTSQPS